MPHSLPKPRETGPCMLSVNLAMHEAWPPYQHCIQISQLPYAGDAPILEAARACMQTHGKSVVCDEHGSSHTLSCSAVMWWCRHAASLPWSMTVSSRRPRASAVHLCADLVSALAAVVSGLSAGQPLLNCPPNILQLGKAEQPGHTRQCSQSNRTAVWRCGAFCLQQAHSCTLRFLLARPC